MKNITLGQYYPAVSIVHKMDARIKIILMTIYIIAIFFIKSYFGYAVTAAFVLLTVLFSKIPLKSVLKSIKGIMFLVIFTAVLNLFWIKEGVLLWSWWRLAIYDAGVEYSAFMALRLILLVMGTTILTLTTTPIELTDGLESLMSPLKIIRFPVHDIAIIMSIALRFIPTLMDETEKIMNAQKARGANFDTGNIFQRAKALLPVLIPLFVSAFRRADELALALDARCYNATPNRTKMKIPKITYRDFLGSIFTLVFVAVIILDTYYWAGGIF